jgi:ribosomal protein S18 acetylase RimI-like enzyme
VTAENAPELELRPAVTSDIDAVLAFWQTSAEDAHRPPDDSAAVRRLVERDPGALVLAVQGDAIVGSLIAGWDGWRFHLYRLAVAPTARRRGIARLLLDAAEERFRAAGATRVDAMVLDGNVEAHPFWAAAGYTPQAEWSRWVKPLARPQNGEVA